MTEEKRSRVEPRHRRVEHGHDELVDNRSYCGNPDPKDRVTLEHVARAVKELDDWKLEFQLQDID